jgi:hypothetical protein
MGGMVITNILATMTMETPSDKINVYGISR